MNNSENQPKTVVPDPLYVRDLFEHLHNRERHIVDRMWESQKYFTTLYTALITATIALMTWFFETEASGPSRTLVIIPLTAIVLLIIGFFDFYRERRADLEVVASLAKIERYLGLHNSINEDSRYFHDDEYLVPKGYAENRILSSELFIKKFLSPTKQIRQWERQTVLLPYIILSGIAMILIVIIILTGH